MTPARGTGLYLQRGHYGSVLCPHCGVTACKISPAQVTCGSFACGEKQQKLAKEKRLRKVRG